MGFRPTIPLGRIAGVEIRLDGLVVLLIGVLFLNSLNDASARNGDLWAAVAHLVLLVAMMVCMLFHELGHALMARVRGHKPTLILLSFVGLTFFEATKARARDEFWIALAGPLVNIAIGVLLSPFIGVALADPSGPPLFTLSGMATWKGFLAWMSMLNFLVAALNLTPGWPTDGARAVRAWLARKNGYGVGTRRAVALSHGLWLTLAGLSVIVLTILPRVQALTHANPTRSPASLLAMYQVVALLLAATGIYYGWAENRRVRRLGDERAAQDVGPPPEFRPGRQPATSGVVNAEVIEGGREPVPQEGEKLTDKAGAAIATGKTMWRAARATGKGTGWLARQGAKAIGALLAGGGKEGEKPAEKGADSK